MRSAKSTGRIIGILLLLQLAAGLMVPFILMGPLIQGSPGFLTAAAESSFQIRLAVLIAFIGGALTVSLGITALPVLRRYSNAAALWFLAVCVMSCTLDAVHNSSVLSMLSLSLGVRERRRSRSPRCTRRWAQRSLRRDGGRI